MIDRLLRMLLVEILKLPDTTPKAQMRAAHTQLRSALFNHSLNSADQALQKCQSLDDLTIHISSLIDSQQKSSLQDLIDNIAKELRQNTNQQPDQQCFLPNYPAFNYGSYLDSQNQSQTSNHHGPSSSSSSMGWTAPLPAAVFKTSAPQVGSKRKSYENRVVDDSEMGIKKHKGPNLAPTSPELDIPPDLPDLVPPPMDPLMQQQQGYHQSPNDSFLAHSSSSSSSSLPSPSLVAEARNKKTSKRKRGRSNMWDENNFEVFSAPKRVDGDILPCYSMAVDAPSDGIFDSYPLMHSGSAMYLFLLNSEKKPTAVYYLNRNDGSNEVQLACTPEKITELYNFLKPGTTKKPLSPEQLKKITDLIGHSHARMLVVVAKLPNPNVPNIPSFSRLRELSSAITVRNPCEGRRKRMVFIAHVDDTCPEIVRKHNLNNQKNIENFPTLLEEYVECRKLTKKASSPYLLINGRFKWTDFPCGKPNKRRKKDSEFPQTISLNSEALMASVVHPPQASSPAQIPILQESGAMLPVNTEVVDILLSFTKDATPLIPNNSADMQSKHDATMSTEIPDSGINITRTGRLGFFSAPPNASPLHQEQEKVVGPLNPGGSSSES
jgi:hypothetical protein